MDVLPLERRQVPGAAAVLAQAFADDEVYRSLWPQPARRARALRAFMAIPVADAYAHGHVSLVAEGERLLAVAAWLPPGAFPLSARRRARALPRLARTALADPASFPRLARFGANLEAAFPGDRPAYLAVVGVAPEAQARGVGTAVLEPGLGFCDEAGSDCYLETASPRAVALYERLGFATLSSGDRLLPGGPTHWRMRRPAS
ncbi:MAG TPA: GNAT family N-acetyltransferase [Solirubrobacteraceae bacterium]|nr:GNAT family N-acetyltransferase [Solirubrobacteraceae bacterium]